MFPTATDARLSIESVKSSRLQPTLVNASPTKPHISSGPWRFSCCGDWQRDGIRTV